MCDDGNAWGCKGCVPRRGYTCIGNVGAKSFCYVICGDGIIAGN